MTHTKTIMAVAVTLAVAACNESDKDNQANQVIDASQFDSSIAIHFSVPDYLVNTGTFFQKTRHMTPVWPDEGFKDGYIICTQRPESCIYEDEWVQRFPEHLLQKNNTIWQMASQELEKRFNDYFAGTGPYPNMLDSAIITKVGAGLTAMTYDHYGHMPGLMGPWNNMSFWVQGADHYTATLDFALANTSELPGSHYYATTAPIAYQGTETQEVSITANRVHRAYLMTTDFDADNAERWSSYDDDYLPNHDIWRDYMVFVQSNASLINHIYDKVTAPGYEFPDGHRGFPIDTGRTYHLTKDISYMFNKDWHILLTVCRVSEAEASAINAIAPFHNYDKTTVFTAFNHHRAPYEANAAENIRSGYDLIQKYGASNCNINVQNTRMMPFNFNDIRPWYRVNLSQPGFRGFGLL